MLRLFRAVSLCLLVSLASLSEVRAQASPVCGQTPTSALGSSAFAAGHAVEPPWKALLACAWQIHGKPPVSATPLSSTAGKFITFAIADAPGGPQPTAINLAGEVVGYYFDSSGLEHSFFRTPAGQVITFDPPGSVGSGANGVDLLGDVTGFYITGNEFHGYIRYPNGTFRTFDPPGAAGLTTPQGMSPFGSVTGSYFIGGDPNAGNTHSFLRFPNNIFTEFFVPDSAVTAAYSVNAFNVVTGSYQSLGSALHGFVRSSNGALATFDAPASGALLNFPIFTINMAGVVTGSYQDPTGNFVYGFLRTAGGAVTTINAPGNNYGTFNAGINATGAITGWYIPADFSAQHGFFRTPQGKYITFDLPGFIFTTPTALNDLGVVAGNTCNASNSSCVGFLWKQ